MRRIPLALGICAIISAFVAISSVLSSCSGPLGIDPVLTRNTYVELVDWHIAGLWVINCPVAWIRVANYNQVPVKDIRIKYYTYDFDGKLLNEGDFMIEDSVPPGTVRNFIEQYLGLVDLHSDKLSIKMVGVSGGTSAGH